MMKMMSDMRMMEPKEDTRPMMTPVKADDDDGIVMAMVGLSRGAAVLAKSRRRDGRMRRVACGEPTGWS